jgi:hypothetical protein
VPTIIDSLIVRLGLQDDLSKSGAAATKNLKDLEGASKSTEGGVKKLGDQSKSSASGVETLTKSVGALFAVLGGVVAIRAFVEDMITGSAAVDRLSKNLNVSAGDITAWGNAAEELGGSAKGVQSAMQLLSKAQTDIQLTGQSSLIPYFNMLGVSLADANGHALKATDILEQLAGAAEGKDRRTMNNVFAQMGFDEGTINLLLKGRGELELTLKRQKEYALEAAKFAPEATKLQRSLVDIKQSFTLLGLSLVQQAAPAIEKLFAVFTSLGDWIKQNSEFIADLAKILGTVAAGLAAIAIASSPITLTVAAVVALAAGIALLWQDYQTWKRGGDSLIDWEKWKPGIDAATNAVKSLAKIVKESFGAIFDEVGAVQKLVNGDWKGAVAAARKSDDKVRAAVGTALDSAMGIAKAVPAEHQAVKTANGNRVTDAYAMEYFEGRGMSPQEAAAYASQIHSESNGKVDAVGDHGAAYGLIQWHADRQKRFKEMFGHDIQQSTADEQLAFIVHETKQGTERSAGKKVAGATSAQEAGALASEYYVRPADRAGEAKRRGDYAALLYGTGGASSNVAAAARGAGSSSSTTNNNDHGVTIHGDVNVQTQATDGPGVAKAFKDGMNGLLVGQAAWGLS